ncbi:hypothetical protein DBR40_21980 [Pedobacter sp. KBW01]|uniref:right-handed parallel beta-helix repeat-containing protein n=1 Tax=Pedobacter sp. KBW01 TaxID=2153364 RepID=UPI000F597122|nr:right-handed parallel beta-helix repeat-containing protein [Pedobacter sp. KBW01]RQO66552.1 hypothetical protein DBR40_21980 [Pedobacter sp. KBW01]
MNKRLLLLLFFFTAVIQFAYAEDIVVYVAPKGVGNGTKISPCSLEQAVAMLPRLKRESKIGSITILLKDGTYELNGPLLLSPENGGTNDLKIIFKASGNSKPVISGGRTITLAGTEVLSADLSLLQKGKEGMLQDIYVDGKRAIRARMPNSGYLNFKKTAEKKNSDLPWSQTNSVQYFEIPSETYDELKKVPAEKLKNIRFNAYHKWIATSRTIDSLSSGSPGFYSTGQAMAPHNKIDKSSLFFFENADYALDMKNEWVIDENNVVKYIPEDRKIKEVKAVVPVIEKLLVIEGDSKNLVTNVSFEGISFCFANKPFIASKYGQAAAAIDAAIMLNDAKNIQFENCRIMHTGQYAIWFKNNVKYCGLRKCYINDLGAGGVRIGPTELPGDTLKTTSNIRIENCIIQSGGKNYAHGVGVLVAHAANNIIIHNDIADFGYSGVSVGWVWGYGYSPSVNNKVLFNQIHHIGWGILSDMAGIYTLGISPGTEINNNIIHDVYSYSYGGWGLYTDEGSSDIHMENNLVYRTKTGGFHQHYGKNNIINNNIIAWSKQFLAQNSRIEKHQSFEFKHNILLSGGETFFQGTWKKGSVNIDSNAYWNMHDKKNFFMISTSEYGSKPDTLSFKQWSESSGRDKNSIFLNPHFKDPEKYDFKIRNKSLLRQIGFIPFDYTRAGVTGDKKWKKLAVLPAKIIQEFDRTVRETMLQ